MKYLITGHRGLLGSACMRHFSQFGDVATTEDGDLMDPVVTEFYMSAHKPDVVIHCAAKVGGVKSNRDFPVEFLTKNLLINTNVINSAAHFGVRRLVNIGTSCMFPKDAAFPVQEESLLTGKLEDSVEAYAIAKIAGWRLCKAHFEQYGREYITVNPCNIYGPNDKFGEHAHVIPALIEKIHAAKMDSNPFEVWGSPGNVREFIYSDDVARAIGFASDHWHSPEVLNIGTSVSTTIGELVEVLRDVICCEQGVIWRDDMPSGIPRKTFSCQKLAGLGWKPEKPLREGLILAYTDFLRKFDLKNVDFFAKFR